MFSCLMYIMSSITLTVTGYSSSLSAYFHPEIELDQRYSYSCCLLDFYTYNSIPNVHENNNKFYYKSNEIQTEFEVIEIPTGSYEIYEIIDFITKKIQKQYLTHTGVVRFELFANKNTMKCELKSEFMIDFSRNDSIGSVLGFDKRIFHKGRHISSNVINIQPVNSIRLDCDFTSGSFHNGTNTHTIYEFSPSVDPGYKINEQPAHLIYLPVIKRSISTLNISIVDQDGKFIDFRGEQITCRFHIKRDS